MMDWYFVALGVVIIVMLIWASRGSMDVIARNESKRYKGKR